MSICKVAEACGVSYSTVSRYINNRSGVSDESARKIQQAMDALNYKPLPIERRRGRTPQVLPGIKTSNIGLIWYGGEQGNPSRDGSLTTNGRKLQRHISNQLRQHGLRLMIEYVANDDAFSSLVREQIVDGVFVICDPPVRPDFVDQLRELPNVWLIPIARLKWPWVGVDDDFIGREAARYLHGRGHRSAAYIALRGDAVMFNLRRESFVKEARRLGLDVPLQVRNAVKGSASSGDVAAQAIAEWAAMQPRPTGLFVPVDADVPAIYTQLRRHGLQPGVDLDVVSCDNDDIYLQLLEPQPATFDQQLELVAAQGVEELLRQVSTREFGVQQNILISPRLVLPSSARE